jgi:hypothetical protein
LNMSLVTAQINYALLRSSLQNVIFLYFGNKNENALKF